MSSIQGVALTLNKLGLDTQNILLEAGVAPDALTHSLRTGADSVPVPDYFPRGELRTGATLWLEVR